MKGYLIFNKVEEGRKGDGDKGIQNDQTGTSYAQGTLLAYQKHTITQNKTKHYFQAILTYFPIGVLYLKHHPKC